MQQTILKCINRVGGSVECSNCKVLCIKYGKTGAGKQRYQCKNCGKTRIEHYCRQGFITPVGSITSLVKENRGIRTISRLLKVSGNTVLKRILEAQRSIIKPPILLNREYEIDEMCTYYKNKGLLLWIVYALERSTRTVLDFAVGTRTLKTLKRVTDTVMLSGANKVYTDKLNLYSLLLPGNIHSRKAYSINHIERKNLTLRTHLRRLNRRTLCFSKSIRMLEASLHIYFWS